LVFENLKREKQFEEKFFSLKKQMSKELTVECMICYEQAFPEDFFILSCCKEKKICHKCLDCLKVPMCPYCRSVIKEIKNNPKYRLSYSYMPVSNHLLMEQTFFLAHHNILDDTIDPRMISSRILRRRLRRMRRLQMRGLL
jgi:hypothetical protein